MHSEDTVAIRIQVLASALRATAAPETETLLGALLIDELSQYGGRSRDLCNITGEKAPYSLDAEVETLVDVCKAYFQTNQRDILSDALADLTDRAYQQANGLARARLLEKIWQAAPRSMQAYGYLRTCYLDAKFADLLAEYPDENVPEEDLTAWIFLAQAAFRSGEHDEALTILRILDERTPGNPFIAELLANVLVVRGDPESADTLYRQLEKHSVWPAALIRLSGDFIQPFHDAANRNESGTSFAWIPFHGATDNRQIFLTGVDDRYARRYLPGLIESLANTYADESWLLHVHLVNPEPETQQWILAKQQAGTPLAATIERMTPRPAETCDTHRIIETRTYYACARFRALPCLLERYARPLWVVDADMKARRTVDSLFEEAEINDLPDIGFIPLGQFARCLSEFIWLSLSYFRPTPVVQRFAGTLARYIDYHLSNDLWGWGLDQTAFFSVITWFERRYPELRVARLPSAFVADPHHDSAQAFFHSLVGSCDTSGQAPS